MKQYQKGYWSGSHYITQGERGYWTKWGKIRNRLNDDLVADWVCQTCAVQQFKILTPFLLPFDDSVEKVKICARCRWKSNVWKRPTFALLIEVIRKPDTIHLGMKRETLWTLSVVANEGGE